jgi:hypothetical protein
MPSSKRAQRAPGPGGELHRASGDPRGRSARAVRHRVNAGRLAVTVPHRPRGGEVHARAIDRLELAVDDRERSSKESDAAVGGPDEQAAVVALAAANEQVAAREAWVKYVEHGY